MQLTQQLAIFLDNRPGTLARVCDALGQASVNIGAISTSDTVDHSVIRMVVSDDRKALRSWTLDRTGANEVCRHEPSTALRT